MTDPFPPAPARRTHLSQFEEKPVIVFEEPSVKVVKAKPTLKKKVGTGGFDPRAIAAAQKRLEEAKTLFPKIASSDIEVITYAFGQLTHATQTKQWLERIQWSAVELRSNGTMFQYPLVAAVADSLCHFFDHYKTNAPLSALAQEVISLHLQTLHIALAQGPRSISADDETRLLSGLHKAVDKALQV